MLTAYYYFFNTTELSILLGDKKHIINYFEKVYEKTGEDLLAYQKLLKDYKSNILNKLDLKVHSI